MLLGQIWALGTISQVIYIDLQLIVFQGLGDTYTADLEVHALQIVVLGLGEREEAGGTEKG